MVGVGAGAGAGAGAAFAASTGENCGGPVSSMALSSAGLSCPWLGASAAVPGGPESRCSCSTPATLPFCRRTWGEASGEFCRVIAVAARGSPRPPFGVIPRREPETLVCVCTLALCGASAVIEASGPAHSAHGTTKLSGCSPHDQCLQRLQCSQLQQRWRRLSTVAPLWHYRWQSCLSLRELQRMTLSYLAQSRQPTLSLNQTQRYT